VQSGCEKGARLTRAVQRTNRNDREFSHSLRPYADTKEHLGGYYIIEVPSLDAALEWAARCPAAPTGAVELRPVVDLSNGGA
jgi:hypothetical protein